jgi:hypothetical protein
MSGKQTLRIRYDIDGFPLKERCFLGFVVSKGCFLLVNLSDMPLVA